MNGNYKIRKIKEDEVYLLKEFTYYAIYVENNITIPRKILEEPKIKIYYKNFKFNKDVRYVCEHKGKIIAMIWSIRFDNKTHGYGYISEDIPEISMSVKKEYRNKEIGSNLLKTFLLEIEEKNKRVSLSVSKNNYAKDLYIKNGFNIFKENEEDYIMIY